VDAVRLVREERPDLVFLDVQMPELDGFEVLAALAGEPLPLVVFVTAFDRHALRAFDAHALDYLLKPFDDARFASTLGRVKERLRLEEAGALGERMLALLADRSPAAAASDTAGGSAPQRLLVRSKGRISFVAVCDIDWIEADSVWHAACRA
jgi:two-component system LytT family response regulator